MSDAAPENDQQVQQLKESLERVRPLIEASRAQRLLADRIFATVETALAAIKPGTTGAVNWVGLHCATVAIGTEYSLGDEVSTIRVLITEASPEAYELHQLVNDALANADGLDLSAYTVEVATEW